MRADIPSLRSILGRMPRQKWTVRFRRAGGHPSSTISHPKTVLGGKQKLLDENIPAALRIKQTILQRKNKIATNSASRSLVLQKTFEAKCATSIVSRVLDAAAAAVVLTFTPRSPSRGHRTFSKISGVVTYHRKRKTLLIQRDKKRNNSRSPHLKNQQNLEIGERMICTHHIDLSCVWHYSSCNRTRWELQRYNILAAEQLFTHTF